MQSNFICLLWHGSSPNLHKEVCSSYKDLQYLLLNSKFHFEYYSLEMTSQRYRLPNCTEQTANGILNQIWHGRFLREIWQSAWQACQPLFLINFYDPHVLRYQTISIKSAATRTRAVGQSKPHLIVRGARSASERDPVEGDGKNKPVLTRLIMSHYDVQMLQIDCLKHAN